MSSLRPSRGPSLIVSVGVFTSLLIWSSLAEAQGPSVIPANDGSGYSATLLPPNGKLQSLTLSDLVDAAFDADGNPIDVDAAGVIWRITSDENPKSDGGDMVIVSPSEFELRAERDGSGDGRVYSIQFVVFDQWGNTTPVSCRVQVPHDPKSNATDSGVHDCVGPGC